MKILLFMIMFLPVCVKAASNNGLCIGNNGVSMCGVNIMKEHEDRCTEQGGVWAPVYSSKGEKVHGMPNCVCPGEKVWDKDQKKCRSDVPETEQCIGFSRYEMVRMTKGAFEDLYFPRTECPHPENQEVVRQAVKKYLASRRGN